mgnify:CR=1 FL=1
MDDEKFKFTRYYMANSKLVSTKYLLRLRSQEEWEGWHFRAKAHFRKSGAWRLISEGHPRDTGNRIQVELPDYRERVLVQHRNLRRIFAAQPDRIAELIPRLPQLPRWRPETDAEFEERCEAADRVNADLYSDLCQASSQEEVWGGPFERCVCCCFQDSSAPKITPSWDPAGGGVIGPAKPGSAAPPLRWDRDPQAIPGRVEIPPGTH